MNPTTVMYELLLATKEADWAKAENKLDSLEWWLARGGFEPEGMTRIETYNALDSVRDMIADRT